MLCCEDGAVKNCRPESQVGNWTGSALPGIAVRRDAPSPSRLLQRGGAPKMRSHPRKKASLWAGLPYESVHSARRLLFRRSDCVFDRLGDVELHHGLGRDLEGFAGLGIAADARLAGGLFQP